jgi:hypothetical protein
MKPLLSDEAEKRHEVDNATAIYFCESRQLTREIEKPLRAACRVKLGRPALVFMIIP